MSPSPARPGALSTTDTMLLTVVFAGAAGSFVLWAGAALTAVLSGHPAPQENLGAGVLTIAKFRGNPAATHVIGHPMGRRAVNQV